MPKNEEKRPKPDGLEQLELHTLTDLAQVKALANPLRVKILELLCEAERTTKQVAEALGEKPTRLYHHVEALKKVGLIRLTRTRQNRGTVEKYYQAIARGFRADATVFTGENKSEEYEAVVGAVQTMMERSTQEMLELARLGVDKVQEEGLLSFLEIRASQEEIDKLLEELKRIIGSLQQSAEEPPPEKDARRFRLTLIYYPLDRFEKK